MKFAYTAIAPAMLLAAVTFAADARSPVAADAPSPVPGIVEQPRPFGYVIGDLVTQRLLLQRDDRDFDPAALPVAGRVGAWFERRAARIERASDGSRWLVVDYQLVNAPEALRTVMLPSWQLRARDGGPPLNVDGWPVSIAPLTPREPFHQGGLDDMRPDRTPPTLATRPLRNQALALGAAALCVALAWGGWLLGRNHRDAARLPFARAHEVLKMLGDDDPAAWHALHRAFDGAAGRVMHLAMLPVLFDRASHLQPMRSEIERFYAESEARFFGSARVNPTLSPRALCRALRHLEQRHAS